MALPGGGSAGIALNAIVNLVGDTTSAYIDSSNVNTSANHGGAVDARAHQQTTIQGAGGSLGVGDVGIGADVHVDELTNNTTAYISDTLSHGTATTVYSGSGGVEVSTVTRQIVQEVASGAGVGTYVGFAGAAAGVRRRRPPPVPILAMRT